QEIERIFRNLTEKFGAPDASDEDKLLRKIILNSTYSAIGKGMADSMLDTATTPEAITSLGRQILRDMLQPTSDCNDRGMYPGNWEGKFNAFHVDPYRLTEMFS